MKVSLKRNNNEQSDFKPLINNRYGFVIEKAEVATDDKEREKINLTLSILGEGEFKNRKVWQTFWLTPTATVYLVSFMENLDKGTDLLQREEEVEAEEIAREIVGAQVSAYLEAKKNPKNPEKVVYKLSKYKPFTGETSQQEDPFDIF